MAIAAGGDRAEWVDALPGLDEGNDLGEGPGDGPARNAAAQRCAYGNHRGDPVFGGVGAEVHDTVVGEVLERCGAAFGEWMIGCYGQQAAAGVYGGADSQVGFEDG